MNKTGREKYDAITASNLKATKNDIKYSGIFSAIIAILFAAVLLFGCSSDVTVVTWDDPKSIAVNQHMENKIVGFDECLESEVSRIIL